MYDFKRAHNKRNIIVTEEFVIKNGILGGMREWVSLVRIACSGELRRRRAHGYFNHCFDDFVSECCVFVMEKIQRGFVKANQDNAGGVSLARFTKNQATWFVLEKIRNAVRAMKHGVEIQVSDLLGPRGNPGYILDAGVPGVSASLFCPEQEDHSYGEMQDEALHIYEKSFAILGKMYRDDRTRNQERDLTVFSDYFREGMALTAIAKKHDVTESRVSQILGRQIKILREAKERGCLES